MPKKNPATVRRTASRTRSSSPPPPMGLIVTANAAECSASSACGLDNRSHRTPLILTPDMNELVSRGSGVVIGIKYGGEGSRSEWSEAASTMNPSDIRRLPGGLGSAAGIRIRRELAHSLRASRRAQHRALGTWGHRGFSCRASDALGTLPGHMDGRICALRVRVTARSCSSSRITAQRNPASSRATATTAIAGPFVCTSRW